MSKILIYINIFIVFLLLLISSMNSFEQNNNSNMKQVQILAGDSNYKNFLEDVFDDDEDELITYDKNCNMTEYPEQAIKCNMINMECNDKKYLHHCSCKEGYITFSKKNEKYCNLEQKKQSIAFVLELCVGFGAGHFYRCAYTMGALKLIAFVFGIVFIFTFPITAKCVSDCDCEFIAIILSIIYYLYLCGLAVWYIWDLVYFGKNEYADFTYQNKFEGEIKLKPW